MTSGWGWRRSRGGMRRGWSPRPVEALVAAVPWLTVGLLMLMLHFISGALTSAEGVLFDLPDSGPAEGAQTKLVALALAMPRGTLVFFDDARYALDDGVSAASFGDHLAERIRVAGETRLLILADRTVSAGDLMKLSAIARKGGARQILFANKREEVSGE